MRPNLKRKFIKESNNQISDIINFDYYNFKNCALFIVCAIDTINSIHPQDSTVHNV